MGLWLTSPVVRLAELETESSGHAKVKKEQEAEVDELYTYLDTQMLHSARERYDFEQKYRNEAKERSSDVAALKAELQSQRASSEREIANLREELATTQAELNDLVEFR